MSASSLGPFALLIIFPLQFVFKNRIGRQSEPHGFIINRQSVIAFSGKKWLRATLFLIAQSYFVDGGYKEVKVVRCKGYFLVVKLTSGG